ncbi:biliverdin-producing heme oxygenase [Ciceribacter sp. L1K22]|uniref:biliverdin-producing heme oxygenase n=1 Tax=Ciceribacter sp. L1K22 TaxID=2820275 RepID=UPI001ABE97F9|nr:biliverdin-producing heme oxygenase [Ciceribacter sp. L1K22]MBO3761269.1 biliverdin-producing heme oxygenase [Ciceribacter sp. L1K22]
MPLPRRRQNLKTLTADLHKRLDDKVGALDSIEGYAAYVEGMLRFRREIEPRIEASNLADVLPGFLPILISKELERDVASIGGRVPASNNLLPDKGIAFSRDELLGVLYVLEGSALGARILVRRAAGLGLGENSGAAHLVKQSSSAGNWNAFAALLETVRNVDEDAMANAALATFATALSAFETH